MELKTITNRAKSGKTYHYDRFEFRANMAPKYASIILAAKEHMRVHYGAELSNPVFLGILCHHWLSGERAQFERVDDYIKTGSQKAL